MKSKIYIVHDFIDELEKLGFSVEIEINGTINITDINHIVEYKNDGKWRHYPSDTIGHEFIGRAYAKWHDFEMLVPYFKRFKIKRESNKSIPSFKQFILTENVYVRDKDEWQMLYHEMWWDFIDRAHSEASENVKEMIKDPRRKPGYTVTGPTEQVNFYEINEPPSPHVVFQKKHLFEDQGPEKVFSIHEYTLEDVKDWWEEQMQQYGKYKAGTLNLDPPDPADAWKDQDDEIRGTNILEDTIGFMKDAIESFDPAGDVKGLYWDAIEYGADEEQLDDILQQYVKSGHLSPEEFDYIKKEPGEPGDRN